MKWEDEDKGYPTLSALSALNLNLDLNPAVRPRYYGFCWGLAGDSRLFDDQVKFTFSRYLPVANDFAPGRQNCERLTNRRTIWICLIRPFPWGNKKYW